jgi:hypothetical protein
MQKVRRERINTIYFIQLAKAKNKGEGGTKG